MSYRLGCSIHLKSNLMKTSSAKAKGRRLASRAKDKILQAYGLIAPDDIIVTPAGVNGPDLQFSPWAKDELPLAIECKNQEALNVWKSYEQAEANRGHRQVPALIYSRNRSDDMISMKLDDFLKYFKTRSVEWPENLS